MLNNKAFNVLAAGSVATLLSAIAPSVMAHTGILSVNTPAVSGAGGYLTAVTITHGCSASAEGATVPLPQKDPVAASVVFPNAADVVATKISGTAPNLVNEPVPVADLANYLVTGTGNVTGLQNMGPSMIQNHDVWEKNTELSDPPLPGATSGVVRAFQWTDGKMQHDLYAYLPFRITLPTIKPDSCVKSVLIRAAAAEYCSRSRDTNDDSRADIWFGNLTTLFNDEGVQPLNYWPTLTVNRPASQPLPAACGAGFNIAIAPTNADVDKYLPVKGYWPTTGGGGDR